MRKILLLAVAGLALSLSGQAASAKPSHTIAAAVTDRSRPADDTARDGARKPGEVLEFSGVRTGDKVGELIPGGGYYTRLLAKVLGPKGKVYALWPEGLAKARPQMLDASKAIGANVQVVTYSPASLNAPEKLDLVWTSENYHDFHNGPPGAPAPDMAAFNKAVFDALKPGGVYLIEDHAAAPGARGVTGTLHRIDPAQVKAEVEAAGFKLEASSNLLANPADPHTAPVFDPAVRGHTDKLLFRFRKPR